MNKTSKFAIFSTKNANLMPLFDLSSAVFMRLKEGYEPA
jgi:hypothetical protein